MSAATEIYTPKFYLVSSKRNIEVSKACTLGRGSKVDTKIDDSKLSSSHCSFIIKGVSLYVKDLNSTNGVYVNGERIAPDAEVKINFGDKILIGSTSYELSDSPLRVATAGIKNAPLPEKRISTRNLTSFFEAESNWLTNYYGCVAGNALICCLEFLEPYVFNPSGVYSSMLISAAFGYAVSLTHGYLRAFYIRGSNFFSYTSWLIMGMFALICSLMISFSGTPNDKEVIDMLVDIQKTPKYMEVEQKKLYALVKLYNVKLTSRSKYYGNASNEVFKKRYEEVMGPILTEARESCKQRKVHCRLADGIERMMKDEI